MKYTWIIVAVVVVLVVLPIIRMVLKLAKGGAQNRKLLQTGVPAPAKILAITPTGTTVTVGGHRQPQVALTLEVQPTGGQPYQAQLVTLISEFQIPQIQPGTMCQVRVDPANPNNMALEAVGVSGGEAGAPMTAIPVAGGGFKMPLGAIIGLVIGLGGAAFAVYVVMVNVGGVGLGSKDVGGVCGQAVACCEKVAEAAKNPDSAKNCENLKKIGVTDEVCQSALDGFKASAKALKVTCE